MRVIPLERAKESKQASFLLDANKLISLLVAIQNRELSLG